MMCHLARDAQRFGRNARYHHCFGDEDGMQWLKRSLVKVCFPSKFFLGGGNGFEDVIIKFSSHIFITLRFKKSVS